MSKIFRVNKTTAVEFHENGCATITQEDAVAGTPRATVTLEMGELQAIITAYYNQREDA